MRILTILFIGIIVYFFLRLFYQRKQVCNYSTKHNVGDVVRVKTLDWYNANKDSEGTVTLEYDFEFDEVYSEYCGATLTIIEVKNGFYFVDENEYVWTDDMFE